MKRLGIVLAMLVFGAFASTAAAAPPAMYSFDISNTHYAPFTSAHCGLPVYITDSGTVKVTVFYDGNGNIVREIDTIPGGTTTFFSPATGLSFTERGSTVAIYDYGSGATINGPATVAVVGFQGDAGGPGTAVIAGRTVLPGTVTSFSPEGIPNVDVTGEPISQNGVFPDFLTTVLPERCAALGGTLQ